MEEWKDIKGYEGLYQLSNYGRVKSLLKEIIMKPQLRCNYYRVRLIKEGVGKNHSVNRLVADAFIDNPDSKPEVGHYDCDTHNNKVNNLYWCTHKENLNNPITLKRYSKHSKGHKKTEETIEKIKKSLYKSILQFDLKGNLIAKYDSAKEASKITNSNYVSICQCCTGRNKTANGYIWKYENNVN